MFDYIAIVSQVELNLGTVVELVAQLRITTGRQLDRKILRTYDKYRLFVGIISSLCDTTEHVQARAVISWAGLALGLRLLCSNFI